MDHHQDSQELPRRPQPVWVRTVALVLVVAMVGFAISQIF